MPSTSSHLDVDHGVAGQHAGGHGLLDALVDRRDVVARDGAAHDAALELVAAARLVGLEVDHDVAVLAAPAGLAHEPAARPSRRACGWSRGRRPAGCPTLASTLNSRSSRSTMISRCSSPMPEMTVWPVSSSETTRKVGSSSARRASEVDELVFVGLGLGLDRDRDDRLGEHHRLEHDRLVLGAQRVAGAGELEADGGAEVAGEHRLDVLALVGVHLQQPADALLAVLGRVVDVRAGVRAGRSRRGSR